MNYNDGEIPLRETLGSVIVYTYVYESLYCVENRLIINRIYIYIYIHDFGLQCIGRSLYIITTP